MRRVGMGSTKAEQKSDAKVKLEKEVKDLSTANKKLEAEVKKLNKANAELSKEVESLQAELEKAVAEPVQE